MAPGCGQCTEHFEIRHLGPSNSSGLRVADYDGLGALYVLAHVSGIDHNTLIGALCTNCGRVLGKTAHSLDVPDPDFSGVLLTGLAVAKDAVRLGIGSALLRYFCERGAPTTWWYVSIDNEPALAMSRQVGAAEQSDGSTVTFTLSNDELYPDA